MDFLPGLRSATRVAGINGRSSAGVTVDMLCWGLSFSNTACVLFVKILPAWLVRAGARRKSLVPVSFMTRGVYFPDADLGKKVAENCRFGGSVVCFQITDMKLFVTERRLGWSYQLVLQVLRGAVQALCWRSFSDGRGLVDVFPHISCGCGHKAEVLCSFSEHDVVKLEFLTFVVSPFCCRPQPLPVDHCRHK